MIAALFMVILVAQAIAIPIEDDGYHKFPKRQSEASKTGSGAPTSRLVGAAQSPLDPSELDAKFWERRGAATLKKRLQHLKAAGWSSKAKLRPARNIILFMGDGMGVTTVTAMRKMKQQLKGTTFYDTELAWDSFPFTGFSKTYSINDVISDSAPTATSFLSGVNTKTGYIGVDVTAHLNCSSSKGHVDSIAHWAFAAGKKTGFVTTTRITHASPSPLFANTPWRDNELFLDDKPTDFGVLYPKCIDIAQQLVTNGRHIAVAMGGGLRNFLPTDQDGGRTDGRNLIEEWLADRSKNNRRASFVRTPAELNAVKAHRTDYLLGLFSSSHLQYIDDQPSDEPRLADMTQKAIEILNRTAEGYFLFVEGGRIDHGHHDGIARYALTEGIEFDAAVERALSMVDLEDTLVIVTADHSHTMSMGGALRHEDDVLKTSYELALDNKTFTSLMYANGLGAFVTLEGPNAPLEGTRKNATAEETVRRKYLQQAIAPLPYETHGAEDVGVYATGVHSELFSGVYDQSYIAWAMACASGLRDGDCLRQWKRRPGKCQT